MQLSRVIGPAAGVLVVCGVVAAAPDAVAQQWNPFAPLQERAGRPEPRDRAAASAPSLMDEVLIGPATDAAMGLAIERYQKIAAGGGWAAIPQGPVLKAGSRDARVVTLRRRLHATGDLHGGNMSSPEFDRDVERAVMSYQARNGLTPSGDVNRFTLAALNISARHRLQQLQANRQRLRAAMAQTQGRRYVLVNIPAYELQAVSGGRLDLSSRVIVGKPATPTPEVSASVRAVNFLPYWHVPESIAARAIVPAARKDPGYLTRERIRVYASWGGAELDPATVNWWAPQGERYVFRQDPGPFNALGLIRLDMPNRHIVYMHDTPMRKLFGFHLRPYSAGCIRVEQIQPLAAWLLAGEGGWSPGRIEQALDAGQQQTVTLASPVPVHFVYLSAWASGGGEAHFRMDIYEKDGVAARAPVDDGGADAARLAP